MSLIKCKECGKEVSELAETCIHCGCPIEKKIYCGECGKECLSSHNVCSNCGVPLKKDVNGTVTTVNNNFVQSVEKTNNLCLAGMIVGIVSFFLDIFGLVSLTGLILSIVGFNQVTNKKGPNATKAKVGIICSSIELGLKIIQLFGLFMFSFY